MLTSTWLHKWAIVPSSSNEHGTNIMGILSWFPGKTNTGHHHKDDESVKHMFGPPLWTFALWLFVA